MVECPRCKIEMYMIDFGSQMKLANGRLLPSVVYRCPKCSMDTTPLKPFMVRGVVAQVHSNYQLAQARPERVVTAGEQIDLFADDPIPADFSRMLKNVR